MAAKGARVHIYGDWDGAGVKRAQQDIGAFERQAMGFSGAMTKSMLGVGAAIGGAFAIGNLVGNAVQYLKDAAQAAIDDEKSVVQLSTALGNLGLAHKKTGIEGFIKKMQMATGVADSDLRKAYQTLVTATGDAAKSQDLLQTAMDASAATGKDLQTVSLAIAKASTGQVSALRRLGIPLDDNTVKTKNFAAAIDTMNSKFGGQAAAAAQTYAGKLARLQQAADEAQETIGYALLNAIDNVAESMGGVGGAQGAMESMGDAIANLITGLGDAAAMLTDMAQQMAGSADEGTDWGNVVKGIGVAAGAAFPPLLGLVEVTDRFIDRGDALTEVAEAQQRAIDTTSSRYTALAASIDPAKAALLGLEGAGEEAADAIEKVNTAADFLKQSLAGFTTRDQFITALREMGKAAREAGGDLLGTKGKSIELRGEFATAATDLLAFAQANGTTAAEVLAIWDKGVKRIRQKLIDNGVDPDLVDEFINKNLWMTKFTLLANAIGKGRAAEAMRLSGLALGEAAWKGMVAGLNAGQDNVYTAASSLGASANAGAQAALDSNSPSRTMYRIGQDAVKGLELGIMDGKHVPMDALAELITGVIDKFNDIKTSVANVVMSALDFNAIAPQFDENGQQVGQSFMDGLRAQAAKAIEFAQKVKQLIAMGLSPAALQLVLDAGVNAGTAIANELITGGADTIAETNTLVSTTQAAADEVGATTAANWMQTGVVSGQRVYEGFRDNLGKGGPAYNAMQNVMDNLAASLTRTATITVTTVNRSVYENAGGIDGARASGGPVSAGSTYLVGEKGPELLTMGASGGFVTPNSSLSKAASATYNISVNAGMGTDGYEVGRVVVDAIKKYERVSGPVFAAA